MSGDSDLSTIQVRALQPGWIVVHFTTGNPAPERRFHLLHQALLHWLARNLHCRLQNIQPIHERGELRGLNVFFHFERPAQLRLSIDVDADLARQYGSEYLEAVMADAIALLVSHPKSPQNVAIVNRRHVAVVVDRDRDLAYVVHVERVEPVLPEESRGRLRAWLVQPTSNHYVVELPRGFNPWDSPPA